jgi:hypothetical protein
LSKYDFIYRNADERYVEELKSKPKDMYLMVKDRIAASRTINQTFYSFVDISSADTFLFIAETKTFARTLEGDFKRLYADNYNESFTIIPACVASKEKHYQTTRTTHKFKSI